VIRALIFIASSCEEKLKGWLAKREGASWLKADTKCIANANDSYLQCHSHSRQFCMGMQLAHKPEELLTDKLCG
jgi:hypothetical protein